MIGARTDSIDPYAPGEMAGRVEIAGVAEARLPIATTLVLAVLGGAFLAIGSAFTTATIASTDLGYSVSRFLGGIAFGLGLVLVVVGGGELFTSNNLIAMAWAGRKVRTRALLRNWGLVYVGNLVGAVSTAVLFHASGKARFADHVVGVQALETASFKIGRAFTENVALGVIGNALVCLAVWLCFSARSTTDKILCIMLTMTALVTLNVDHVVANMYYLTAGLLAATDPAVVGASGMSVDAIAGLTVVGAIGNLVPVTIGNIIGGSFLVASVYWFVYLRESSISTDSDVTD